MKAIKISSSSNICLKKFYWTPKQYEIRVKGESYATAYVKINGDSYDLSIARNCMHIENNKIEENFKNIQLEVVEVTNCESDNLIKLPVNYTEPKNLEQRMFKAKDVQGYTGHEIFDFDNEFHNL